MTPKLYKGMTVLYTANLVDDTGRTAMLTYPAIVTSFEANGDPNLTVFFDHHVQAHVLIGHPTSVEYSFDPKPHSWRLVDDEPAEMEHVSPSPSLGTATPEKKTTKKKGGKK